MEIRRATKQDMDGLNRLLFQVLEVHHKGRPDLFKGGVKNIRTKNWPTCCWTNSDQSLRLLMKKAE